MGHLEGASTPTPQVIENYRDFEPPPQLRPQIERLLQAVPRKYLAGLKTVLLTNRSALTREQRRQKVTGRKGRYSLADARGAYYQATDSRSAYVLLMVDNMLSAWPVGILRIPYLGPLVLAETLYHEIGHHIHAVHEPIHDGKENVAERWQHRLKRGFIRRRYWYLRPLLYPAEKLAGILLKLETFKKYETKS